MGLIVLSCYVQVILVIPFALHVWQSYFRFIENFVYAPCGRLCRRKNTHTLDLPAVRMINRATEDGDSGIEIMGNGNGSSEPSDSSSTGSGSSMSETNVLIPEPDIKDPGMENKPNTETGTDIIDVSSRLTNEEDNPIISGPEIHVQVNDDIDPLLAEPFLDITGKSSAESRWTELQQIGMLKFIARPIMFFFLVGSKFNKHKARLVSLSMVFLFAVVMLLSWTATAFLKPTDRPPQFFKPSSNIQKMLDLTGNLTDSEAINCYSCSAWYGGGTSKSLCMCVHVCYINIKI